MRGLSPSPAGLTDRRAAMERVSSGTRASVLVLVLAVAILVAACGSESSAPAEEQQSADSSEEGDAAANPMPIEELTAASCTPFPGVPPTAWDHLEDIPADYTFGTFPRTADIHSPDLLIWNFYPAPVDQMWLGHNLEHGGIYVQYGDDVPADTVEQIGAWWMDDPNGIIVAPLPELDGDVIALGAWYAPVQSSNGDLVYSTSTGELAYCTAFDEVAFTAFRDAFRGMGPERLPIESLTPGR